MLQAEVLEGSNAYAVFSKVGEQVYQGNSFYRGTENSIMKLLLHSPSAFKAHAQIKMFVVRDGNDLVARFALIYDQWLPDYIQVSYFEAQKGLGNIFSLITNKIKTYFPDIKKVVVGLNGHLNYGAGMLLNHFEEAPLFGLPYNPDYYADYFKSLRARKMVTFRFTMEAYNIWAQTYSAQRKLKGLHLRFMNKKDIKKESAIYTQLNNQAFTQHPYWAKRDAAEDVELFYPFRFLLDNENLIFAEVDGRPVGFFLWYPDFNSLKDNQKDLNIWDVVKYRLGKKIDTFRFTEIGIIPEYQRSPVALALISKSLPTLLDRGYKYCEGGFIFEENRASMAFVQRILQRCYGEKPEPYREFAVFETTL